MLSFLSSSHFKTILKNAVNTVTEIIYPDNSYIGHEDQTHSNDDIMCFYDFEGGNTDDKSGNNNHATMVGNCLSTVNPKTGLHSISGSKQDYLNCGNISITPSKGFTISLWFYCNVDVGGYHTYLYSLSSSIYLQVESDLPTKFRYKPNEGTNTYGAQNVWHHLLVEMTNDNQSTIYVDSVSIFNGTVSFPGSNISAKFIWGDKSSKNSFGGYVDNIRMFNNILSEYDRDLLANEMYLSSSLKLQMSFQIDGKDTLNQYNGVIHGDCIDTTRTKYGGKSLTSDGLNQSDKYILMPAVDLIGDLGLTLSFWFYNKSGLSTNDSILFEALQDDNNNGMKFSVSQYVNDRSKFRFSNNNNCVFYASVNTWHKLVITITKNDIINIYVDDDHDIVNIFHNHVMPSSKLDADWKIGSNITNLNAICSFDGSISEFKLWNRILTYTEIVNVV